MYRKLLLLLLIMTAWIGVSHAQHIAIRNNVLYDLTGALSAGVEIPCSQKSSIDVYGSIRPWKREAENVHKHWLTEVQYRYWTCQVMNGFFLGPYAHVGEFNLGNYNLLPGTLRVAKNSRYEGWLAGLGFGIGYEYALAKHWNIGAEIGVGYTYINYKAYACERCGKLKDNDVYHYIGPSRIGLSILYVF